MLFVPTPMVKATQNRFNLSTQRMIDRILEYGQLSRQEHLQLTSVLLSGQRISEEERRQINRIFDGVQTGQIHLLD